VARPAGRARPGPDLGRPRTPARRPLGVQPGEKQLRENPAYFLIEYYTVLSWSRPPEEYLDRLTDPARAPDALQRDLLQRDHPDRETSRARLRALAEEAVNELLAQEERLRTEVEGPSLARLVDRSPLLEGPKGALLARYERMHDAAFHRAYKALLKGEVQHDREGSRAERSHQGRVDPGRADGIEALDQPVSVVARLHPCCVAGRAGMLTVRLAARPPCR
jgi:hypothetical protein